MPRRLIATAAIGIAALATAACNIEPVNISGTVTARSTKYNAATHVNNYYLTVAGQTFRVYSQTYQDCPPGKTYPTCKN